MANFSPLVLNAGQPQQLQAADTLLVTNFSTAFNQISGNRSAAYPGALVGFGLRVVASTYTDTSSITGTIASIYGHSLGAPTFNATNTITYTMAATLFIDKPPATGMNVTNSNVYALVLGGDLGFQTGTTAKFGPIDAQGFNIRTNATTRMALTALGIQTHTQTGASSGSSPFVTWTQSANTGGSAGMLLFTAGTHTGQTATEVTDINFNLSASLTMVDGTVGNQRSVRMQGRTYNKTTTLLTLTKASTLSVDTPVAGAGVVINTLAAIECNGNLLLPTAGNKIFIKEGSSGSLGQTTLVAGTKAITITGLTTSSRAFTELVTASGASLTIQYQAVCTANTLTIQANVAAGTINVSDASVLNYVIFEPAP